MLLKERIESGMTVREWCHDRNIKESRYYYWLRILRRDAVENKEHRQQVSPLVELPADICRKQVFDLGSTAAVIRKGNITIEVTKSASAGLLQKLWRCWPMLGNVKRYSRIYLAYGYTDLRYGMDGLARVVQDHFSLDPFQKGCLFLFCGRRTDRIKGLLWEGDGFVLVYKRLEAERFQWPRTASEAREITPE